MPSKYIHLLLFCSLFFGSLAHSQVTKANQGIPVVDLSSESEAINKKVAKKCTQSLCHIPEKVPYELSGYRFSITKEEDADASTYRYQFLSEVWPLFEKYIDDKKKKVLNKFSKVKKSILQQNNSSQQSLTPVVLRYFRLQKAIAYMSRYGKKSFEYRYGEAIGFTKEFIENMSGSEKDIAIIADKALRKSKLLRGARFDTMTKKLPFKQAVMGSYKTNDFASALNALLNLAIANVEFVIESSPYLEPSFDLSLLKKNRDEATRLEKEDENKIITNIYLSSLWKSLIQDDWEFLDDFPFDAAKIMDEANAVKVLSQQEAEYSDEKISAYKKDLKAFCSQSAGVYAASRPTKSELNVFSQKIDQVRAVVIDVAKGMFPSQEDKIDEIIPSIAVNLPIARSAAIDSVKKRISSLLNPPKRSTKEKQNFSNVLLVANYNVVPVATVKQTFSELKTLCAGLIPMGYTDVAYIYGQEIDLSSSVVKNIREGLGVLSHEYGHILYRYLNKKNITKLLACLAGRHFYSAHQKDVNYKQYINEDFSDHFAAMVINKMKPLYSLKNFACLFFHGKEVIGKKYSYFGNTVHPLVWRDPTSERYSTHFARLMNVSTATGVSSSTCDQFRAFQMSTLFVVKQKQIFPNQMYICNP